MQCEADGSGGSHQCIPFQAVIKLLHKPPFSEVSSFGKFYQRRRKCTECVLGTSHAVIIKPKDSFREGMVHQGGEALRKEH